MQHIPEGRGRDAVLELTSSGRFSPPIEFCVTAFLSSIPNSDPDETIRRIVNAASDNTMRGTILYGPRDVRFEECDVPRLIKPTDAIIRISATCVCGSDLWPYSGISPVSEPTPMGHEYCGIVEEVGS
jgi:hypothetical protein